MEECVDWINKWWGYKQQFCVSSSCPLLAFSPPPASSHSKLADSVYFNILYNMLYIEWASARVPPTLQKGCRRALICSDASCCDKSLFQKLWLQLLEGRTLPSRASKHFRKAETKLSTYEAHAWRSLGILKQKHMVKLLRLKVVGNHPSKINHIEKLSCNSPKKYRTHCLSKKAVVDLSHVNRERGQRRNIYFVTPGPWNFVRVFWPTGGMVTVMKHRRLSAVHFASFSTEEKSYLGVPTWTNYQEPDWHEETS